MYFHIITFQIFFPGSINYYIINKIYYISIKHNKWVKKIAISLCFIFKICTVSYSTWWLDIMP